MPNLTTDANSTTVRLDDFLHNSKTKTRAAPPSGSLPTCPSWIDLIEPVKETRQRFIRGVVLFTGSELLPFGRNLTAMPVSALWRLGA